MVKYTQNTKLAYNTNTQAEFDKTFMASVIRAMNSLELSKVKDKDMVEGFYQALKFNLECFGTKGKELAQIALTHNYEYIFTLAQAVSKELNLQFTDNSHRAGRVEATQKLLIIALTSEPKPKPKRAKYIKELNIAEVAVMPICTMPNIYFGVFISGKSFEYKRENTYAKALKITKPRKIKVEIVPIVRAVTTAKAQKTDMWIKAHKALIAEYDQKVKELFGYQKYCA